MDRQLDKYRKNGQTNCVEDISVLNVLIRGWKQEKGTDIMVVMLDTKITDYVVDDNTGDIVRGSRDEEKYMCYEWILVRTTGVISSRSAGITEQTCPKCGARVDVNQSAVCNYCGTVIEAEKFDWAVRNIRGISQRTVKKSMINKG